MPAPDGRIDYDRIANFYDDFRGWKPHVIERVAGILSAGKDAPLLELGAGTGNATVPFAALGGDLTAIDRSHGMLLKARRKLASVKFVEADATTMPFPDGAFAGVFSVFMLHHIGDLAGLMAECFRVLRSGRVLFMTTSHAQIERNVLCKFFPGFAAIDKARFPEIDAVRGEMSRAGFRALAVEEIVVAQSMIDRRFYDMVRSKFISTFELIGAGEFEEGLRKLKAHIESGNEPRHRIHSGMLVWGEKS